MFARWRLIVTLILHGLYPSLVYSYVSCRFLGHLHFCMGLEPIKIYFMLYILFFSWLFKPLILHGILSTCYLLWLFKGILFTWILASIYFLLLIRCYFAWDFKVVFRFSCFIYSWLLKTLLILHVILALLCILFILYVVC